MSSFIACYLGLLFGAVLIGIPLLAYLDGAFKVNGWFMSKLTAQQRILLVICYVCVIFTLIAIFKG